MDFGKMDWEQFDQALDYQEEYGYLPNEDQLMFESEMGYEFDEDDDGDFAMMEILSYSPDDQE